MENFNALINTCSANSTMFSKVVEEFLLKNVVNHKKLAPEINTRFAHYRHIIKEFQDKWHNMLHMQCIVHAICKKDGLIKNYLKHSAVQRLAYDEQNFLHQMAMHPWKFSFSIIVRQPAEHFFEMEDVFTGESFLLYSPGIASILKERAIMLSATMGHVGKAMGLLVLTRVFNPMIFSFSPRNCIPINGYKPTTISWPM
jgi:hypothetical protein